jgi:phosphomannomutase
MRVKHLYAKRAARARKHRIRDNVRAVNTPADTSVLVARARAWAASDPDPTTRDELLALLATPDVRATDLEDRFSAVLEFGTAGLRGVLGAGPNRMNRAVVLRTTWGLARYLLEHASDAKGRGVVIGYDCRRLSREFAEDTACVLTSFGIQVHLFPDVAPTPATAFASKHLDAAAAVMVTASHNPPEYNGYKVYWGNGAQIIPPTDTGIAKAIELAPPANEVPRIDIAEARAKGIVRSVDASVTRAYLDAVRALEVNAGGDRSIAIVYTPMHGVGDVLARFALTEAGFTNVTSVPEQQKPDGAFPTVAFPNPEEKGAMDLSFALARKLSADLVLANDPDADRLAAAVKSAASPTGYMQFSGNQVGILLGHYLLTEGEAAKTPKRLVLASIVSSPMLGTIAHALGVRYEETLTGFKWIANRAMELEREGYTFIFGYEEALGYTVGRVVRDKDGVSAAMILAEMAAVAKERGKTLADELEAIYRTYGLFVSSQVTVTKKGAAGVSELRALMTRLRTAAPRAIGVHEVIAIADYETRVRTVIVDKSESPLSLPRTNMLIFELRGGSRIIARPSGTEPKVKFYIDLREEIAKGESLVVAEAHATHAMQSLAGAFVAIAG